MAEVNGRVLSASLQPVSSCRVELWIDVGAPDAGAIPIAPGPDNRGRLVLPGVERRVAATTTDGEGVFHLTSPTIRSNEFVYLAFQLPSELVRHTLVLGGADLINLRASLGVVFRDLHEDVVFDHDVLTGWHRRPPDGEGLVVGMGDAIAEPSMPTTTPLPAPASPGAAPHHRSMRDPFPLVWNNLYRLVYEHLVAYSPGDVDLFRVIDDLAIEFDADERRLLASSNASWADAMIAFDHRERERRTMLAHLMGDGAQRWVERLNAVVSDVGMAVDGVLLWRALAPVLVRVVHDLGPIVLRCMRDRLARIVQGRAGRAAVRTNLLRAAREDPRIVVRDAVSGTRLTPSSPTPSGGAPSPFRDTLVPPTPRAPVSSPSPPAVPPAPRVPTIDELRPAIGQGLFVRRGITAIADTRTVMNQGPFPNCWAVGVRMVLNDLGIDIGNRAVLNSVTAFRGGTLEQTEGFLRMMAGFGGRPGLASRRGPTSLRSIQRFLDGGDHRFFLAQIRPIGQTTATHLVVIDRVVREADGLWYVVGRDPNGYSFRQLAIRFREEYAVCGGQGISVGGAAAVRRFEEAFGEAPTWPPPAPTVPVVPRAP